MRRPGRRGGFLLLMAAMFAGHSALYLAWPATPALATALRVPLAVAPLKVWGLVWLAAAAAAVVSAFRADPAGDRWGFHALGALATLWAGSYAATGVLAGGGGAFARGLLAALLYGALAGVVLIVAGWPECPPSPAGAP